VDERKLNRGLLGRSLWGLGTAAASAQFSIAGPGLSLFERGAEQRSQYPRAMAFAALGAAAVLGVDSTNRAARSLLSDIADVTLKARSDRAWPWPEPRLYYANALLPDAMIAVGVALERPELVVRGLDLLGWLLARETRDGHLSVTPAEARDPVTSGPALINSPLKSRRWPTPAPERSASTIHRSGSRQSAWRTLGLTGTMTPKS